RRGQAGRRARPRVAAARTRRGRVGQVPAGRPRVALRPGSGAAAMLDIGFPERPLPAAFALPVLGPERLPAAAGCAGLWARRPRAQWFSVRAELERELAADERERSLQEAEEAAARLEDTMRETGAEVQARSRAAEEEARR